MKTMKTRNRTLFDLLIVTILSILLAVISLSIHFVDKVYDYFYEHSILELAEFSANFVFLYLMGLTWFALHRWRKSERERIELENVISSINNDALIVSDRNRNINMCNDSIERMLGYTADEVINKKTDFIFFDTQAYPEHWHEIYETLEKEGFHVELATGRKKDNTPIPLEIITWNLSGRDGGAVQLLRDITERKRMEDKLKAWSLLDELTGLYNRRGFFALAEQQLKLSKRANRGLLLFYIDLDRLKWINDNLGHSEGDHALTETANIFRSVFRTSDIIARVGGDEFAIIAIEATSGGMDIIKNRIQKSVEIQNSISENKYELSLSIGVVYYDPEHPYSVDELMRQADELMYEHKRSKYNQTVNGGNCA
jgi:diguanylate cyclase (GGDEF)-like protein/PAS domain S-box-containing protein